MRKEKTVSTCPFCGGDGKDYDPRVQSDPVEGHKMTPLIPCLACRGKGEVPTDSPAGSAFVAYRRWAGHRATALEKRRLEEERMKRKLVASVRGKLTAAERRAVGL